MIKIGIVGAGGMGTVHYHNYQYIDACQVSAVVGASERDRENAEKWGIPLYASISEMLKAEDIDVVDICTPTFLHKTHALESLSHGKDTIVEKPAALSGEDAGEMFSMAREKGCRLYVAQVMQFTKEITLLRELVEKQTFGKPLDAFFERLSSCPEWAQGGWLFDKSKSGLLPFDLHIHDLDVIVSLFGKPEKMQMMKTKRQECEYVEHYRMLYEYENLHVVAEAAWYHASIPFRAAWRVCFENAVVVYDGTKMTAYPYHEEPIVYDIEDEIKVPTGINVPPTGWYLNELKHFVSCIQKKQESPYVPEAQILNVLGVLEEMNAKNQNPSA